MNSAKILLALCAFFLLAPSNNAQGTANSAGFLLVANQFEHSALLIDLSSEKTIAAAGVDINGHEVAVSPDGKFGYVPIYGNSGVGKPGTDGRTIHIVDLTAGRTIYILDLGAPVRPHSAKFGPDGFLYVTAELANAVDVIDVQSQKIVAQIPTGKPESHMLVISPDGTRAYTANVSSGTISVLDLRKQALVTVIPVAKKIQRLSLSSDGKWLFTHDQDAGRIAVIDTSTNAIVRWLAAPFPIYSSQPTPDGKHLVVMAPAGRLVVLNLATGAQEGGYEIPGQLGEVTIPPDGSRAYVSCPQGGTIEVLNLQSWLLEKPIRLTKGVDGLAWFPSLPH